MIVLDTDSTPPALAFLAFVLLFSYLSVAEHSVRAKTSLLKQGGVAQWVGLVLSSCKYACIIASTLLGVAFTLSVNPVGTWYIAASAASILMLLILVDRGAFIMTDKFPRWTQHCSRPFVAPLHNGLNSVIGNGFSGSSNGNGLTALDSDSLPDVDEPAITQAELGSLDQRDREMLRSILRLDASTAREIMVPRLDMMAVELSASLADATALMIQSGHSRLPVYEETLDRVVGIVHARDLLSTLSNPGTESLLRDMLRSAHFIPEVKRLDELLEELQDKGIQMAILVDEYGGIEGLVTMEDLLEEIVGEIEDEFSRTTGPEFVQLQDGAVLVDARTTTEDVEDLFGTAIDSQDVDTVGGYVYRTLGRIPQVGDVVYTDQLRIEVVSILGRRLRKLRIDRLTNNSSTSAVG